jgi:hypothetical protein
MHVVQCDMHSNFAFSRTETYLVGFETIPFPYFVLSVVIVLSSVHCITTSESFLCVSTSLSLLFIFACSGNVLPVSHDSSSEGCFDLQELLG